MAIPPAAFAGAPIDDMNLRGRSERKRKSAGRNQKQLRFEPRKPFDGVQHVPVVVWQSFRDCTQSCTSCQTFAPPTKAQTCAVLMLQRRS
jgi:hypothetical protein